MSPLVALATSEGAWAQDDDAPLLVAALAAAGIRSEPAVWNGEDVDWGRFDLVVVRSTWDYVDHHAAFLDWARRVSETTHLENPAEVLRWNTDKHYLAELGATGIPVVPTTYLHSSDQPRPTDSWRSLGAVVVKPVVSAGSRDTARYDSGEHGAAAIHVAQLLDSDRDVMVQPYLRGIESHGETGVVFLDGMFSHAFRKAPLLSDGRAAVDGLFAPERIESRTPSRSELDLAHDTLAVVQDRLGCEPLLYARIDLVTDDQGDPSVLEVELTEPSFFLSSSSAASTTAAAAISRRLAASGSVSGGSTT